MSQWKTLFSTSNTHSQKFTEFATKFHSKLQRVSSDSGWKFRLEFCAPNAMYLGRNCKFTIYFIDICYRNVNSICSAYTNSDGFVFDFVIVIVFRFVWFELCSKLSDLEMQNLYTVSDLWVKKHILCVLDVKIYIEFVLKKSDAN